MPLFPEISSLLPDRRADGAAATSSRRTHWISSVQGDPETLAALDRAMARFYGEASARDLYQRMLDLQDGETPEPGSVRHLMPRYVCDLRPESVLEVGCGNGRVYRQLRAYGYAGSYSGIDVPSSLISANAERHPEASWNAASAYAIPFAGGSFDVCFSLYVLEHLVFPARALTEMVRVLRPGGRLVLVFPDFVEGGILPSQQVGLSPAGRAVEKLAHGRLLDACVSLYDSRFRLPRLLRRAPARQGPFPVNARPLCLDHPALMGPDVDAIYITSKREVHAWAEKRQLAVEYPAGTAGEMAFQAFMVLTRPDGPAR